MRLLKSFFFRTLSLLQRRFPTIRAARHDEQSFCALPWKRLNLKTDGSVQLCCQGSRLKDTHGNPLTVYEHSLDDIWNSADMRAIRRAMVSGIRVEGCRKCWEIEERGGSSKRMEANDIFLMEGKSIHQLKLAAEKDSFYSPSSPCDYQLDLGNVCNLKCRTCFSQYSSRIAADPIHRRWEGSSFSGGKWAGVNTTTGHKHSDIENYSASDRFPSKLPWYENHDFLIGELLKHPEHISSLQIIGGEPLVARQLAPIIRHLATNGTPERVAINLTTNGTIFDPSLFNIMAGFRNVSLSVSIDGVGEYFEYIRYPGKWPDILEHLVRYAEAGSFKLYVLPTFHIYNALHITDVFRFCDHRKLPLIFNTLWTPRVSRSFCAPTDSAACRYRSA